ncbi:SRPBCC family protein [Labedaea rhizosphaerae]|uniref:Polyketide cyclase/dehydrase/lipid transport protein n=1 Tax=Labedaea rhizosphaerae TaxID=598644 RepID=A0A4R6SMU4_LABRH|nr:SRPBCC family protein [Labedaea rhizosphaerae]TDQ04890.1 polyketide cyclase/dehydrase/lipid transport protein [Labedaea rhizosphaerae]
MPRREYTAHATERSSADPDTVYELVSNAEKWTTWAGALAPKSEWARKGTPEPAGVGAIRKVGLWPVWVREETTAAEPGRRHEYVLRSRGPIKSYVGEVLLTKRPDGGTDIEWTVRFTELVPGTGAALHVGVQQLIKALAGKLARGAERA